MAASTDLVPTQGILSLPGVELTDTHLKIPGDIEFPQWQKLVEMTGRVSRSSQYWVGDALLAGEMRFGEVASQYSDLTGYDPKTLMNFIWVCRAVAPERRRSDLTFGHHALVAGQPSSLQAYWLTQAAENKWTIVQLREAMQPEIEAESRVLDDEEDDGDEDERADVGPDLKAIEKVRGLVASWYSDLPESDRDKSHDRTQRCLKVLQDVQQWVERLEM